MSEKFPPEKKTFKLYFSIVNHNILFYSILKPDNVKVLKLNLTKILFYP
jgi:hypothetical protein